MTRRRLFEPFSGWLIKHDWTSRVIAGAYDSKSPEQRRRIVAENPHSYLGVTRSREDLEHGDAATDEDLLQRGADTLTSILEAEAFEPTGRPTMYAYRLTAHEHTQIGVVGAMDVGGYSDGRILTHENVRPTRAKLLGDHLHWVGATSSPVSLTYRADPVIQGVLHDATVATKPDVDHFVEGVRHQVWALESHEAATIADQLAEAVIYVTDGHHRAAAALAGAAKKPEAEQFQRTLAVLFPDDALQVEPFHRRCLDAHGRTPDEIIAAFAEVAEVEEVDSIEAAFPHDRGHVGVYIRGRWWRLVLAPVDRPGALAHLDVERVRRDLITGVLGIDELAPNSGIDYVPNPAGLDEVVRRCDLDGTVGLFLYPTSVSEIMAVAEAHELMPPKSSYVAPKPRSGLFLRILGSGATAHIDPS